MQKLHELDKLVVAIWRGHINQVKSLLDTTPNLVNEKDKNGNTALHWVAAAANSNDDIENMLLARMFLDFIEAKNNDGWTALHWTAGKSREKFIENIREKIDSSYGTKNIPLLHWAVQREDKRLIKILLAKHKQDTIDDDNKTALHYAAHSGNQEIIEILLLKMNSKLVNAVNNDGETALHLAVRDSYLNIFKKMEQGRSQQVIDENRYQEDPALHKLARKFHKELVAILIKNMSQDAIDAVNKEGYTALHLAVVYEKSSNLHELLQDKTSFEHVLSSFTLLKGEEDPFEFNNQVEKCLKPLLDLLRKVLTENHLIKTVFEYVVEPKDLEWLFVSSKLTSKLNKADSETDSSAEAVASHMNSTKRQKLENLDTIDELLLLQDSDDNLSLIEGGSASFLNDL